jgi:hypothetical protein
MKKVRAPARVLRIASGSSYEASGFRSKKVRGAALNADDQPLAAARLHQASRDLAPDGAGGAGDPEYHVFVMCQVYLVSPPRSPTFGETLCFSEARRSYEPSWAETVSIMKHPTSHLEYPAIGSTSPLITIFQAFLRLDRCEGSDVTPTCSLPQTTGRSFPRRPAVRARYPQASPRPLLSLPLPA